ncbi:MAG: ATP-binding cassette domain-containing protein [Polyangiaceae bacterium]|nr:ATP-binding cassette domain-containing protein [Polyangiaceae bacterium]
MIEFRDVHKSFGSQKVLQGIDFRVERGESFYIVGTSGAGKSVIIQQIVGILQPDQGDILVDGQSVATLSEKEFYPIRRKCALVFQNGTLLDSMTAAENVAFPLLYHGQVTRRDAQDHARLMLGQVEMLEYADTYPGELGDGMRKRVAIARAMATDPEMILFDEPTTSLDPVNARRIDRLMKQLSVERGITSIVVSHDIEVSSRSPTVWQCCTTVASMRWVRQLSGWHPRILLSLNFSMVVPMGLWSPLSCLPKI